MLVCGVIVNMINAAFLNVVGTIGGNNFGIIEAFLFIVAYASFILTVVNKSFSLIYLIPEKALRYIGGHPESYGEAEAVEQFKSKAQGGMEAAGAAAKGVGSSVGESAAAVGKKAAKGKKKDDDDQNKPGPKTGPSNSSGGPGDNSGNPANKMSGVNTSNKPGGPGTPNEPGA
jgi:defect-in-organelle-trafficking protein DotA